MKKGWLGVPKNGQWGAGDKNYLQNLFAHSEYKDDFLDKVLEGLFFDTLNVKRDTDSCGKILGDNIKIPYLNGGLFEKDLLFDSTDIQFPKEFFSNPEKKDIERKFAGEREAYPYTESSGILDFFGRYNFTIDETDPYEQEIGVDPEMLGKIFENLLEDNKDKGAFYTPKEIVQYMCRESLIAYLLTDSHIEEERVREFVLTHRDDFTETEKRMLKRKLRSVKICDPAVGSGAFPMGMLNELYACRHVIEEDAAAVEIKKQIVRENIYGVDIEKGAVDIARLRFWLAIIVDETEPLPLPNLDYKIMQGNSLLESFEGIDLSNLLRRDGEDLFSDSNKVLDKLLEAIHGYFVPNDSAAKNKIRKHIEETILSLLHQNGFSGEKFEKLKKMDLHANSEFFLWHTWFSDVFNRPNSCNGGSAGSPTVGAGGFDIVIGNPPYRIVPKDDKFKSLYDNKFVVARGGKRNLYHLFFEQGISLLRKDGTLSYITPDTYFSGNDTMALRQFLVNNTNIKNIIHYTEKDKIFENVTQAVAVIVMLKQNHGKEFLISVDGNTEIIKYDNLSKVNKYIFKSSNSVIDRMERGGQIFSDVCDGYQGEVNLTQKKDYIVEIKRK